MENLHWTQKPENAEVLRVAHIKGRATCKRKKYQARYLAKKNGAVPAIKAKAMPKPKPNNQLVYCPYCGERLPHFMIGNTEWQQVISWESKSLR